jgi:hypothetical protein
MKLLFKHCTSTKEGRKILIDYAFDETEETDLKDEAYDDPRFTSSYADANPYIMELDEDELPMGAIEASLSPYPEKMIPFISSFRIFVRGILNIVGEDLITVKIFDSCLGEVSKVKSWLKREFSVRNVFANNIHEPFIAVVDSTDPHGVANTTQRVKAVRKCLTTSLGYLTSVAAKANWDQRSVAKTLGISQGFDLDEMLDNLSIAIDTLRPSEHPSPRTYQSPYNRTMFIIRKAQLMQCVASVASFALMEGTAYKDRKTGMMRVGASIQRKKGKKVSKAEVEKEWILLKEKIEEHAEEFVLDQVEEGILKATLEMSSMKIGPEHMRMISTNLTPRARKRAVARVITLMADHQALMSVAHTRNSFQALQADAIRDYMNSQSGFYAHVVQTINRRIKVKSTSSKRAHAEMMVMAPHASLNVVGYRSTCEDLCFDYVSKVTLEESRLMAGHLVNAMSRSGLHSANLIGLFPPAFASIVTSNYLYETDKEGSLPVVLNNFEDTRSSVFKMSFYSIEDAVSMYLWLAQESSSSVSVIKNESEDEDDPEYFLIGASLELKSDSVPIDGLEDDGNIHLERREWSEIDTPFEEEDFTSFITRDIEIQTAALFASCGIWEDGFGPADLARKISYIPKSTTLAKSVSSSSHYDAGDDEILISVASYLLSGAREDDPKYLMAGFIAFMLYVLGGDLFDDLGRGLMREVSEAISRSRNAFETNHWKSEISLVWTYFMMMSITYSAKYTSTVELIAEGLMPAESLSGLKKVMSLSGVPLKPSELPKISGRLKGKFEDIMSGEIKITSLLYTATSSASDFMAITVGKTADALPP